MIGVYGSNWINVISLHIARKYVIINIFSGESFKVIFWPFFISTIYLLLFNCLLLLIQWSLLLGLPGPVTLVSGTKHLNHKKSHSVLDFPIFSFHKDYLNHFCSSKFSYCTSSSRSLFPIDNWLYPRVFTRH